MKKKGICLLLALGMVLGLCACGNGEGTRGKESAQELAVAYCYAMAEGDGAACAMLQPEDAAADAGMTEEEMIRNIEEANSTLMGQHFGGTGEANVEVVGTQSHTGSDLEETQEAFRVLNGWDISAYESVECSVTVNGQTKTVIVDAMQIGGCWYATRTWVLP